MTEEQKAQLIIILRALNLYASETEDSYRYVDDLIRDLSSLFSEDIGDELDKVFPME